MRGTVILVEQQLPKGVFFCDHAGRVIHTFSLFTRRANLAGDVESGAEEGRLVQESDRFPRELHLPNVDRFLPRFRDVHFIIAPEALRNEEGRLVHECNRLARDLKLQHLIPLEPFSPV